MPEPVRLSDLLAETSSTVEAVVSASVADRQDRALVEKALTMVNKEIDDGVRRACDQDVCELLARGWAVASELRGYCNPDEYPPQRIVRMALAKHPMQITIDPELSLSLEGVPVHQLELSVEFDAKIEAAVLIIQAAAITALEAGTIRFGAKLRWRNVELPLKLKTYEVTIPGRIRLTNPIPLSGQHMP